MSGVVVKVTENKLIVTKEDKKVRITSPYANYHYDATFASDAETLAGTETAKAISPASLEAVKDVKGGFASKAYTDGKVSQTITEDVTDKAPSEGTVFDALALKANAGDVTASLALKADITLLNTEKQLLTQEIDALKKSAIENSNAPYLTASDYGAVALAKNSVGVGTVGVDGVTVENLVDGEDVAISGTITFTSVLNNIYWDSLHKAKLTGTGEDMTVTNDTGAVADVMIINLTNHGLTSLTEVQLTNLLPTYFSGEKTFGGVGCIKATGKNLINLTGFSQIAHNGLTITRHNDEITINGTALSNYYYKLNDQITYALAPDPSWHINKIGNIPIGSYTFKVNAIYGSSLPAGGYNFYIRDKGNTTIINTQTQITKALTAQYDFYSISLLVIKDTVFNNVTVKLQLEQGVTATNYTPYVETRQYLNTYAMNSNATLNDVIVYRDGKYYHTHNVDSDGNAIATPYDTEVETNGQFLTLSEGTVTYEPWYPDIAVYTDKFTLTKAITAIKELYKYGSPDLITDAVIAEDGLSFTSASLTAGDLAYGVFEFDEPLRPLLTIKSRNDDATIADTANGKVYTFRPVITNGAIASWTVTEV